MFDREREIVEECINCVYNNNEQHICFDAVYSTAFEIVYRGEGEKLRDEIINFFQLCVSETFNDISRFDCNEDIKVFINNLNVSIENLEKCFCPIYQLYNEYDMKKNLMEIFYDELKQHQEASDRFIGFISFVAHNIIYMNAEDAKRKIKTINDMFGDSNGWDLFLEEYYEAIDALFTEFTYYALSNPEEIENVLQYIAAAQEMINKQKEIWDCLPRYYRDELLNLSYYDLCDSVMFKGNDNVLNNMDMFYTAFLDDFNNFGTFNDLINNFFVSNESRTELVDNIIEHYIKYIAKNLAQPKKNPTSSANAHTIVRVLSDVFQKLDLISQTLLNKTPLYHEKIDNFKKRCISKESGLSVEHCAAIVVGRLIEDVLKDNSKRDANMKRIDNCGKLINYSNNKYEYIILHNTMMYVRTFQCGGRQYTIENDVLKHIESYFPPDISKTFNAMDSKFKESDIIYKQWIKKNPDTKFNVFITNKKSLSDLNTESTIILPKEMKEMQTKFIEFYKEIAPGKKIEFCYDDNLVSLNAVINGKEYKLDVTVSFTTFAIYMANFQRRSICIIMKETGLSLKEIKAILKKTTREQFRLFLLIPTEIKEETIVEWNSDFDAKAKYINIPIPSKQTSNLEKELKIQRIKSYQRHIIEITKTSGPVSEFQLQMTVASSLSASFDYNNEDYDIALDNCIKKDIVARRDGSIIYCNKN